MHFIWGKARFYGHGLESSYGAQFRDILLFIYLETFMGGGVVFLNSIFALVRDTLGHY